ncbi:MAG TPA: response regulator [Thermoanaerobaculia bacterium]|nr:response regulator [Thermoanaerobaculia bacterium]
MQVPENETIGESRPRALIVDDDDPIRTMLTKLIERQNLSVDQARDGEEAIERLDDDGYNVILLDLMMPRVDGFGVLRHMREHHPEKLRCTIIASAVPESEILRNFDVPVYKIHPKPFDMAQLIADVRACAATGSA